MFGYIRVLEGELKIKDFGLYRGVYCGLCKTMKNNTGLLSPFTLTYDFVLLALLRSGINGEGFTVRPGKCIAHPIKKRPIAKENEALRYCAAVSAVLTYYKLLDDKNDKDAENKVAVKVALSQAKRNLRKAIKIFPEYDLEQLSKNVAASLNELTQLENAECDSCNVCADAFGKLLGVCFSHCVEDEKTKAAMYELGFRIGRWIYIIDLCDDFEKDRKKGAYNPLLKAGFDKLPDIMLKGTLARETQLAYTALKEINISYADIFRILENIICLGMPEAVKKVFQKTEKDTPLLSETTD